MPNGRCHTQRNSQTHESLTVALFSLVAQNAMKGFARAGGIVCPLNVPDIGGNVFSDHQIPSGEYMTSWHTGWRTHKMVLMIIGTKWEEH